MSTEQSTGITVPIGIMEHSNQLDVPNDGSTGSAFVLSPVIFAQGENINRELEENKLTHFDRILHGIASAMWSSFRVGVDCFTNKRVDEEDFISSKLNASNNKYKLPGGWIHYSKKNNYYMDMANIVFRINENLFPITFSDIPRVFTIQRTTRDFEEFGRIQNAFIINMDEIRTTKGRNDDYERIYIHTWFPDKNAEIKINNDDDIIIDGESANMYEMYSRCHLLADIIRLNNIDKITIKFETFPNNLIDEFEDNSLKDTATHINKMQEDWVTNIFIPALERDNIKDIVDIYFDV